MKTKAEIIASLPERFREIAIEMREPYSDIDTANFELMYSECLYAELLKAFKVLIEKYS